MSSRHDPTQRLLASTRRRLFLVTLSLLGMLVAGIGLISAFAGLRALDADVDRSLEATVAAAIARTEGELPREQESGESQEEPAASDTVLLYLDTAGRVTSNPSGVSLAGLPDVGAIDAARSAGRDLRSVRAGGIDVRLLTVPIVRGPLGTSGSKTVGFLQAAFVLTLHNRQSTSLVVAIAVVAAVGLAAAALVTLLVTGRALIPIRRTFEAQRRFVADASHELRTPAALIRANAEVLQREDLVAPPGRPLVDDIVGEADRLARLVADLLALAAAEVSPLVLEHALVDLADIARDATRRTEALAAERGIRVTVNAPKPAVVSGDRDRLFQLLLILLDNAIDHSPPDGAVTVEVRNGSGEVQLAVGDQGPGIPAEERERIFEPFARLAGINRDRAGGTGLGLAIGRRIALAHGGTITAATSPSGGALFVVALPSANGAG